MARQPNSRPHHVKTIPVKVSAEEKRLIENTARGRGQATGPWLRMLRFEAARSAASFMGSERQSPRHD